MRHLRTCLALSVIAAINTTGCNSPTSPSRTYLLVGAGTFASADATTTILGFHLSLDGSEDESGSMLGQQGRLDHNLTVT